MKYFTQEITDEVENIKKMFDLQDACVAEIAFSINKLLQRAQLKKLSHMELQDKSIAESSKYLKATGTENLHMTQRSLVQNAFAHGHYQGAKWRQE